MTSGRRLIAAVGLFKRNPMFSRIYAADLADPRGYLVSPQQQEGADNRLRSCQRPGHPQPLPTPCSSPRAVP